MSAHDLFSLLPNCVGLKFSSVFSRIRTWIILSSVSLSVLIMWRALHAFGVSYLGLLALLIGTITTSFQHFGCSPFSMMSSYILHSSSGMHFPIIFSIAVFIPSGPAVESVGLLLMASQSSLL